MSEKKGKKSVSKTKIKRKDVLENKTKITKKVFKKISVNGTECKQLTNFKLTKDAVSQILLITKSEKLDEQLFLRIMIDVGGCSGMRYHIIIDDYISENDLVHFDKKLNKPLLVIDDYSFTYLENGTLDFEETFEGANFKIDNPNSGGSCSCGSSFSACGNY